ncbi:MAG TPA: DUF928 domain-containing protein [Chroococcales cyanobacterium]
MAQTRFRFGKFSSRLALILALITGCFVLGQISQALLAQEIPQRWESRQYQPPRGIGTPGHLERGGTRSPSHSCLTTGKALTALVPSSKFGVTVSPYPTFFAYMPDLSAENSSLPVEFTLEDADGNNIYKAKFETRGKAGILTLALPSQVGLPPLKVGQDYKWTFSIVCQPDERSKDVSVEGWTRRVELKPSLQSQLAQASLVRQVDLYAEAEIWQDALATLVQLRRDNPGNSTVVAMWQKLLSAAGLEQIGRESLVSEPTTPQS